jgi:hypothetical protein
MRGCEMYATIIIERDGGERLLGHRSNTLNYHRKRMRGWAHVADEHDVAVEVRKTTKARGTEVVDRREVPGYSYGALRRMGK